jgi:hypothetical protein
MPRLCRNWLLFVFEFFALSALFIGNVWADQPAAKPQAAAVKAPDKKIVDSKSADSKAADAKPKERAKRVLFIVVKNSLVCDQELARLKKKGGDFDAMRAHGWSIGPGPENHLQIIDRDAVPEVVEKLQLKEFPTVVGLEDGEVGRYFRYGCTTPLDAWTFGFLLKGVDERPAGMVKEAARVEWTGHYPLRGNHWSVEGDWNPTREKTLEHLHGPNHQSELEAGWHIEDWSLEELRSVHDDLHEKYDTGGGAGSSSSSSSSGSGYLKFKGGR